MLKSKAKLITIAFIIFVISFFSMNNNYAKCSINEVTNWRVVITSDTKELKDTRKIKFEIEDNPYVVKGKLAPGLKAIARIDIDLSEVTEFVDIQANIDESLLCDCFNLKATLNGKEYISNSIKTINTTESNRVQELILELEWLGNNNDLDTMIGTSMNQIRIPITINVSQHL